MKKIDVTYYLFLSIILIGGLVTIVLLYPNKTFQFLGACLISIIYAVYGIIHHYLAHNLVGKIMVEYILVAMLGIAVSYFIFRGGFGF